MDRLDQIWMIQQEHQRALGLDPSEMSDAQRRNAQTELIAQAHEEVSELGRLVPTYKRHLLRMPDVVVQDAAEEVADVMKCLIAWAQLQGITIEQVVDAYMRKTLVMNRRMENERLLLKKNTRLIATDLDDVVCDISEFRRQLETAREGLAPGAAKVAAEETFKDKWYRGGAFMDCPPIDGAPEALHAIRDMGYKIVFITARPQWQYKRLQGDTLQWLAKHDVPHDLLLFNKDKCEALYEHVQPAWPVAFIEDHERNARALSGIGVNVLLYDQPHNQSLSALERVTRVKSWADVLGMLKVMT